MVDEVLDPLAADRGGRGTEGRIEEYPLGALGASAPILSYGADLHGWCIRETAGAAAAVRIRDGRDNTGPVMAPISLAANGTAFAWFGDTGIAAEIGLFLEWVSGAVEATIYAKAPGTNRQR